MKYVGIDDIYLMAKPGDKLEGDLAVYPTGLSESRIPVRELTFWECLECLLGKPDVIDGADYFLKKKDDGSFTRYGIIREVNGINKAPAAWIFHVVNKYCDFANSVSNIKQLSWKKWELQNCYHESTNNLGEPVYTCCINENGCAYVADFKTLPAVWAYLKTNIDADGCHKLDERIEEEIKNAKKRK